MNNKIRSLLPAVVLMTCAFSSCSSTNGTKDLSFSNNTVMQTAVSQNAVTSDAVTQNAVTSDAVTSNAVIQNAVTQKADVFSVISSQNNEDQDKGSEINLYGPPLSGLTGNYIFSTGAGGWSTELRIEEDGSFSAFHSDGNYASDGNNGTIYMITYCSFKGSFGDIRTVDEHTVTMTLRSLLCSNDPSFEYNTEYDSDSKAYYREMPYGFEDADTITIYRKGTKTGELPQTCLDWLTMSLSWGRNVPAVLDHDVLYNSKVQSTFIKTEEQ